MFRQWLTGVGLNVMQTMHHLTVHAAHASTGRETTAVNTLLIQNNRLEFNLSGHPALRTI
jgi:hypothetical protein